MGGCRALALSRWVHAVRLSSLVLEKFFEPLSCKMANSYIQDPQGDILILSHSQGVQFSPLASTILLFCPGSWGSPGLLLRWDGVAVVAGPSVWPGGACLSTVSTCTCVTGSTVMGKRMCQVHGWIPLSYPLCMLCQFYSQAGYRGPPVSWSSVAV